MIEYREPYGATYPKRPPQQGYGIYIALVTVLMVCLIGLGVWISSRFWSERQVECQVTDKTDVAVRDHAVYRIYTKDCGVLEVHNEVVRGKLSEAEIYASIKPGHFHNFTIVGVRLLAWYPNIIEAQAL